METNQKNSVMVELHDLTITEQKDDRYGRVITTNSLNEDDLVNIAVSRRTEFSENTMRAVIDILKNIAIEEICKGASVHFGMGYFHLNVNGVFIGDGAKWDSSKHSLAVHVTPTAELRNAVNNCSVNVRGMAASTMVINSVTDVATGEINTKLSPGGGVNVTGSKIKVEGDKEGIGIKLIKDDTKEEILIPLTSILVNQPSKLSFILPVDLATGDYRLAITTQYTTSNTLRKEPRTFVFDYLLEVNA